MRAELRTPALTSARGVNWPHSGRGGRHSAAMPPGPTDGDVPDLSVVLPVYDGAGLVPRAARILAETFSQAPCRAEFVFVDDGSTDGTHESIAACAAADPRVRLVRLPVNRGKGAAVAAGMAAARGRVRAFTDADVPFGAEPLLEMYRRIASGACDAAVGDRSHPHSETVARVTAARRTASWCFSSIARLLAPTDVRDTQCGVKAFDGEIAALLFPSLLETGFAFDVEVLFVLKRYGFRLDRVPVRLQSSGPSTVHLVHVALPMLVSLSKLRGRWRSGAYEHSGLREIASRRLSARSG